MSCQESWGKPLRKNGDKGHDNDKLSPNSEGPKREHGDEAEVVQNGLGMLPNQGSRLILLFSLPFRLVFQVLPNSC